MSKFLGFIHYIMFDKIKFQESLNEEVYKLAKEKGYDNIPMEVDELGVLEAGELEDIIDGDNIHGWLQSRIGLVESRFAKAVYLLVKEDKDNLKDISNLLKNLGKKEKTPSTIQDGYELINSKFLDGMPCDRAVEILEDGSDSVMVKINIDKHSDFWSEYEMGMTYWDLRDAYIQGVFENSEYNFYKLEDYLYKIGR